MSPHRRPGKNAMLAIHFYKIILNTNHQSLKIPKKFTRKYGNGLSNPVFLKPRDGTKWKVNWTEQNGEVWFQKGWKEFSENYSLDHGSILVFKYDGTSELDVLIFEKSALEIDYPCYDTCDERGDQDQGDDESLQILEEVFPNQKLSFSPRPHKKMRGEKASQRTSSLNCPKDLRAKEVAQSFISNNPFFTLLIKPTHLAECQAGVPNLEGCIIDEAKDVKLRIGRRSWDVKLSRCYSRSSRCFSAGWSLFASESELRPGDVCIFELISTDDLVFEVHVFKAHLVEEIEDL